MDKIKIAEDFIKEYCRIEPDGTVVVAEWLVIMPVEKRENLLRVARAADAFYDFDVWEYDEPPAIKAGEVLEQALKEVEHLIE